MIERLSGQIDKTDQCHLNFLFSEEDVKKSKKSMNLYKMPSITMAFSPGLSIVCHGFDLIE
jgi:hypothetical protein